MEIEIKQEKLKKALGLVSRITAGSQSTLPILNNVLIRVQKKKAQLLATNLDMAIVAHIPNSKSKDGEITVPARLLNDFVSVLPSNKMVKMAEKNHKLSTSTGQYKSTINGVPAKDFPELPEIDQKNAVTFKMGVEDFSNGLGEVIVASSNDLTRPALTGVYFNTNQGSLYVAATDGYRLADKMFIKKVQSEIKAIVPTSSLQEVLRCIDNEMEEIEIVFDETQVRFRLEGIEITSKLIDGSYPDYRQLIPKKSDVVVEMDKEELVRVTKLAALFAREVGGSIVCRTDAEKNKLIVEAVANEFGENSSEINVKVDKDVKVTVNSRYLLDALNSLEDSKITMSFSNNMDPIVLRNQNKAKEYTHIIMPLKSTE